jgi:hypothetical protein
MTKVNLGTRKLSKTNYTYVISIPKVWVDNVGIKENELLSLFMTDKRDLVIKPFRCAVVEKIQ